MFARSRLVAQVFCILLYLAMTSGCGATDSISTPLPSTQLPTILPTLVLPTATSTPVPVLVAQGYHRMAYDSESNKVILWGGQDNSSTLVNETWVFDFNTKTWQFLNPGIVPPSAEGPMAYDSQSDQIILFLGATSNLAAMGETWAYDYNANTWKNMEPAESPFGLLGARMVYDSESDRMVLLSESSVTWTYDFESNTWTKMEPTGKAPAGTNFFAMSYDAGADRVIAWKCLPGKLGNKVGAYDYNTNTWELRETELYPAHCDYNTMVYDPNTGLNILFGGVDTAERPTNTTWVYDYATNSWKEYLGKNSPGERGWHAMVYDSSAGLMILFGGGTSRSTFTNETWVYDPLKNEWNALSINP